MSIETCWGAFIQNIDNKSINNMIDSFCDGNLRFASLEANQKQELRKEYIQYISSLKISSSEKHLLSIYRYNDTVSLASFMDFILGSLTDIAKKKDSIFNKKSIKVSAYASNLFIKHMSFAAANGSKSKDEAVKKSSDFDNLRKTVNIAEGIHNATTVLASLFNSSKDIRSKSETIASASEEMVSSVSSISKNAANVTEESREAETVMHHGIESSEQAIKSIQEIIAAVEVTQSKVNNLAKTSDKISEILSVIDDISKQTNLLALNATIEAARAGEAGKGFSVVANEVKILAGQTSKATEDIKERIIGLQQDTNEILSAMSQSAAAVKTGEQVISETSTQMHIAAERIVQIYTNMNEISAILGHQETASREISEGISAVAKSTADNDEMISSLASAINTTNETIVKFAAEWSVNKTDKTICELGKLDHIIFTKCITDTLIGQGNLKPHEVPDHHNCRLGKWYDNITNIEIKSSQVYRDLLAPHEKVHAYAQEALRYHASGDVYASMNAMNNLSEASHIVLKDLTKLADMMPDDNASKAKLAA